MARFVVDGGEYEAAAGQTILEALDAAGVLMNGVDVPHYCWHPKLSIDGSCRLCQVEIEGAPKLQIACDTQVEDGMVVHTRSSRVQKAREGVMELLLINHPLDCPICDQAGECKLQDYAFDYGVPSSRSEDPRRALKKKVDLGPTIVFDQERCILCRRCVRFCNEVSGSGELAILARGDRSVVETFPGQALDNPYSMNVADICPVGALTTKDFRFKVRVWFLDDVPGVCTGCSKGCNVQIGVANNKVQRYVPRRNDTVNQTWMCDAGRLSYKEIGSGDRIQQSLLRDEKGRLEARSYATAIEAAAARLRRLIDAKGAGVIAGVASANATNEDLFSFKSLLGGLGTQVPGVAVLHGEGDGLLIQEEKAANAAGARAMGFSEASAIVHRIRGGGVDGLLVLGHELIDAEYLGGIEALENLDTVIVIDTHHSALDRAAHVLIPGRHAAEKLGSVTNHEGWVQRVEPALEPAWEAHDEGESLLRLSASLGLEGFDGRYDVHHVSAALAASEPAFRGIDLKSLGPQGVPLAEAAGPGEAGSDAGTSD